MLRPRGRHRRSLAVLTSALLGGLALVLTPPAAKAQAAPPTRPTGPPTSQALHRLLLAVPRTVSTTAAVGYRLVGATVLGTAPQPVVGGGAFDLLHGVGRATLDQPSGSELVVL